MSVAGRDIFTVGHSTHKLEAFIGLLKQHGVTAIADVRSQPFSRLPEYNRDALSAALKREGIQYVPLGRELGARRDEPECYVDGQAVYERVAQLPLFHEGIERLLKGAKRFTIALMCAEKEPLNCHRTVLVCRFLRPHGLHIRHILADGTLEEHAAAEKRLMKMMRIAPDLFQQDVKEEDLIERAYKERGKQIAYRMNTEGASMNEPTSSTDAKPITIFTIGFAGKTAQEFFEKLQKAGVKRMIDVRLNNVSQLAGFTKRKDLEYFLRVIADIGYAHFDDLAPTKDILDSFKKQKEMDWTDYERRFNALMEQRSPETHHLPDEFDQGCLLCSEATPENCHRRLVAEHLRRKWGNVVIKHL